MEYFPQGSRVKGAEDRLRKKLERKRDSEMWLVVRGNNVHAPLPLSRGLEAYADSRTTPRLRDSLLTETQIPAVLCLACRRVISNTLQKNQVVHLHTRVTKTRRLLVCGVDIIVGRVVSAV